MPAAPSLSSPGALTAARARLEVEVTATARSLLATFAAGVRRDAEAALDAVVLLAAGSGAGNPFTLASVLEHWLPLVSQLVSEIAERLGLSPTTDEFLIGMVSRLNASSLPGQVFDSARNVLVESLDKAWSKAETRRALEQALSPSTPAMRRTLEGLAPEGMTWESLVSKIARTEATAAFGHTTLAALAQQGYSHKRWVAHHDKATRPTHLAADGQVTELGNTFVVGGYALESPGDPTAPDEETANCRCVIVGAGEVTQP